jgi:hypothetical protein
MEDMFTSELMECETDQENRGRKGRYSQGDLKINLPSSRLL